MYEEILQITIPPIIISLVFAAGVFYRRVNDLEVELAKINVKRSENSEKINKINESLAEVRSELKAFTKSQAEFRAEVRAALSKSNR